jgi:hypothetical protein
MEYLQESTNLLSTPNYFKQWLNTKQLTEIIGEKGSCNNCPIANFLKDNNYPLAYVGSSAYSLNANYSNTEKWEHHTDWMKYFVYKLDSDKANPIQITKELALNILRDL